MSALAKATDQGELVPASESATVLQIIGRAASDPNVDIDKMERLLAMRREIRSQEAEQLFNDAMSDAQAEMQRISTDAENPQTRSRYATYAQLDRHLRPIYTRHGFSLSFNTAEAKVEGFIRVLCYVSHKGGHTRTYEQLMPSDGMGAKGNAVMTKTHAAGSAMSYGMRYALKGVFNVAIGEDDDDGNGGDYKPPSEAFASFADQITQAKDKEALEKIGEKIAEKGTAWTTNERAGLKARFSNKLRELGVVPKGAK